MYPGGEVYGIEIVNGLVYVFGSLIVASRRSTSASTRVIRSTTVSSVLAYSGLPVEPSLSLKLVVSTTSVLPSKCPRESPM
jgi:hypothetical protein